MNQRTIVVRLLAMASGVIDGSVGRAALLSGLAALYADMGGAQSDLNSALPAGTQLDLSGAPAAAQATRRTQAQELKRRSTAMVEYWIRRTGRDPKRTQVSEDRVRTVAKALKHMPDEEAMQAIANVADDDWRQGGNDRNRRFDQVEHIFGRGIARLEELRDMEDAPLELHLRTDAAPKVKQEEQSPEEMRALAHSAKEKKNRARKGGDHNAFNRWSREERRLRRAMERGTG